MRVTILPVGLAAGLVISSACHAQESPAKPPELKVLEKFVGTWDSETVAKPAEWTPKGVNTKGTNRYEWVLDGRFLQNTEQNGDALFLGWWTYQTPAKAYRGWFFMSDSSVVEWKGKWDDEAGGLRMEAEMGNGIVLTGANRFPDKDTYEWTFLAKDKGGKVYLDVKETHRRRKTSLEQPKEKRGEPGSPELKVLERYLGTWDMELVNKVAEWNPKEMQITARFTNEWVLDGRFVQMRAKASTGVESIQMRTYDPQEKRYRAWVFDSKGTAASSRGAWEEEGKTLTWKGDLGDGITATNTVRFVSTNTIEWRLVARNDGGKVFMDMAGTFKRKK